MIKRILENVLTKIITEKLSILITIFLLTLTPIISVHFSKKASVSEVNKYLPEMILQITNKTHTNIDIVNDKLALLVDRCGAWSGGAWLTYNAKSKEVHFNEVFANDPYMGGAYPTKYVKGNDFYLSTHTLDDFAYGVVNQIEEYAVIDTDNDLWQYSRFFKSIKENWWKITNQTLKKRNLPSVLPQRLYLATVKYSDTLIYIFALTTSEKSYCNLSEIISSENDKIHRTGIELKKLSVEAEEILKIFNK
jgi:hypothetical protein